MIVSYEIDGRVLTPAEEAACRFERAKRARNIADDILWEIVNKDSDKYLELLGWAGRNFDKVITTVLAPVQTAPLADLQTDSP